MADSRTLGVEGTGIAQNLLISVKPPFSVARYDEAHVPWHPWGDRAQEPTPPDALIAPGELWPGESHGRLRSRLGRGGVAPAASRDRADACSSGPCLGPERGRAV